MLFISIDFFLLHLRLALLCVVDLIAPCFFFLLAGSGDCFVRDLFFIFCTRLVNVFFFFFRVAIYFFFFLNKRFAVFCS